jgi:hypothetical protein
MEEENTIVIKDIMEIVPVINNNIIEFKKIVHKLERSYRSNRYLILENSNQIKNLKSELESIKIDINKLGTDISNINNINNIKLKNSLDYLDFNYKLVKYQNEVNSKLLIFSSAVIFYLYYFT